MSNCPYRVTICSPIYGVEKYIERCAISLFEQTYSDIDYIFVNDCTKDRSLDILKDVIKKYPHKKRHIRIINHQCNMGLGEARNTAIKEVSNTFLMHVDSDDYIDTNLVETLVRQQVKTGADIVKCPKKILYRNRTEIEDAPNYEQPKKLIEDILSVNTAGNIWGALIRTSLYKDNNIIVEKGVNQSEDFQVMTRLLFFSKKISSIEKSYYYYDRSGESSYSNNLTEKSYSQIEKTITLLDAFFNTNNEERLNNLLWEGFIIFLCRDKISFCRSNNQLMYKYTCTLIDRYLPLLKNNLALKYKVIIQIRNWVLFKMLIFFK